MVLLYHFWQYRAYFSVRYCPRETAKRLSRTAECLRCQFAPRGGELRSRLCEPLARVRGGGLALSVLANVSPPPPEGEARPGFLQASGGLPTWLSLRGRYVPVGRCPAADRGGSRDAGTALAVTERARRRLAAQLPGSHLLGAPPAGKGGAKPLFP